MGFGMSARVLAGWVAITALLFMSAVNGGDPVWVVVWVLLSGPVYLVSLLLHPNRNCWSCRGGGQHRGVLFDYARRNCTSCAGTGTKPRWGRKVFFPSST